MGKYNKTVTAVVTGLLGWAGVVVASPAQPVTAPEWLMLGVGMATALGVYAVANDK